MKPPRTDRDFAAALVLFGGFLLGGLLFALVGCGTLGGAAKDLHEAASWLPHPWDTVADVTSGALLTFVGHKTVRHVKHHRAMKKALEGK